MNKEEVAEDGWCRVCKKGIESGRTICDECLIRKQERERFEEMINKIKTEIEALNEKNHLEGVRDIFEKSEVDRDKEMIKIAYESQLHLLENIKQKLKEQEKEE